jgi:hypothetical protein
MPFFKINILLFVTLSENSNLYILNQISDDFQSLDKQNNPRSKASGADCDALFHKDAFILTLVSSVPIVHAL